MKSGEKQTGSSVSKLKFPSLILFISFCIIQCKSKTDTCDAVKTGRFYFYPKNSDREYHIIRDDSIQLEIDGTTMDTSVWKVQWHNECTYTLKFVNASSRELEAMISPARLTFVEIIMKSKEYYVFRAGFVSFTSNRSIVDTFWINPKKTSQRRIAYMPAD